MDPILAPTNRITEDGFAELEKVVLLKLAKRPSDRSLGTLADEVFTPRQQREQLEP